MLSLNTTLQLVTEAFDLFPDAVLVVDSKGIIRNANKQVTAVIGYRENELKNKPLSVLLPERYRAHHHHFVNQFFANATVRKMGLGLPLYGLHKSGNEMQIDIALSVVETGSEKFALAVIRDISDKMNLVHQLNNLEKINQELEQFAYILTHDLKAPLHKIKMLAYMINMELSDKESANMQTMIKFLNDSVSGMESLIHGVLNYYKARLSDNDREDDIDTGQVLNAAIGLVQFPANFTVDKTGTIFPVIKGNETMLLQVFLNLIGNAAQHNKKDHGILQVRCVEKETAWEFSFADNGTAVPEDKREKIFELAAQLGSEKSSTNFGLGLPIVAQIIEHNHPANKIWCTDTDLGGCCIKFTWQKR